MQKPKTKQFDKTAKNREGWLKGLAPFIALAVLLILNALFVKNFAAIEIKDGRLYGSIIDIFHRATPVLLVAIGMTLVIATKGIDLSVGAVMAIAGTVSAILLTQTALPVPAIILIGLVVGAICGMWNGSLVAYLKIQPIIATLILMVAGRGIAQLLTDGQKVTFESKAFEFIGTGSILGLPATIYISAVVFIIAAFLARKTVLGTYIEAVGGNQTAADYCGVNTAHVKLFVYTFCGLCAALAGMIATADIKVADASNVGMYLELDAILAVVIGGTLFSGGRFNLSGTVAGALLIQALATGILMKGLGVEYARIVKAAAVIIICFVQTEYFRSFVSRLLDRRRLPV